MGGKQTALPKKKNDHEWGIKYAINFKQKLKCFNLSSLYIRNS